MRGIEERSLERDVVVWQVDRCGVHFDQRAHAVDCLEALRRCEMDGRAGADARVLLEDVAEAPRVAAQRLEQRADVGRERVLRGGHVQRRVARRVAALEQSLVGVEADGRADHADHRGCRARREV